MHQKLFLGVMATFFLSLISAIFCLIGCSQFDWARLLFVWAMSNPVAIVVIYFSWLVLGGFIWYSEKTTDSLWLILYFWGIPAWLLSFITVLHVVDQI